MSNPVQRFPWSGTHPWDVDVLVVGGGPAGLSALTRLRWMKTMNPIPLSVALVNSGPLGGLARLGNSILTGPALAFPAGELVTRLKKDLESYPAPIIKSKVVSINKEGQLFTTTLEDGTEIISIAVIMACGMLDLRNIDRFWQKGVTATFGNRANIIKILNRELGDSKKPIILGGSHLLHLQDTILALNPNATLLIDSEIGINSKSTIYGSLQEITVAQEGMKVTISSQTKEMILETDRLILEFNSLELNRSPLPKGLRPNHNGYLQTQEQAGLYIAGDCGGPPFSAVVALGEGTKAGLEAYQYGHQFKYGKEAPLFAYYGDNSVESANEKQDDYLLQDEYIPVHLLDSCPAKIVPAIWDSIDGRTTIGKLKESNAEINEHIIALLEQRAITFCPQTDQT